MKLGVIPPYGLAPIEDPEFAVAFARMAEELGFESLWVVEHVVMAVDYDSVYPYDPSGRSPFTAQVPQPDPLVWLSYVAAATRTIRLATGVLILPQRNPVVLAKELATLDRLSGGRMELGIGLGWVREEAQAVGTPFDGRGRRADEAIEVMRTLWREPVASFHGDFTNFDGMVSAPTPVQSEGVPITIGGHSRAAARRAGRLGDGFFPLGVIGDELQMLRTLVSDTALEHGRDPRAIELTCLGTPEVASYDHYRSLSIDRMVVACLQASLDDARRTLEPLAELAARET